MNFVVENQRLEDKTTTLNFSFYCLIKSGFLQVFREVNIERKNLKQSCTNNL